MVAIPTWLTTRVGCTATGTATTPAIPTGIVITTAVGAAMAVMVVAAMATAVMAATDHLVMAATDPMVMVSTAGDSGALGSAWAWVLAWAVSAMAWVALAMV